MKIELANKALTKVYLTNDLRTKNTAKPLAYQSGLTTNISVVCPTVSKE